MRDRRTIEAADPRKAIAEESARHDLMILGLADDWHASSGPLSGRHANLAEMSQCSLLIVHPNPHAPVVEAAAPDAVSAASAHVAAKATGTRMAREVRPRRSTRAVGGERFTPTTIPGEAKPRV